MLLRSPPSARRIAAASVSRTLSISSVSLAVGPNGRGGGVGGLSIQFCRDAGSIMRRSPCGTWDSLKDLREQGEVFSASWGGRDRHLGSFDRDDKPKRADGVGEGRPPWFSAFPVDGGVLFDCIGVGDLEMVWNDLADGEG